MTTTQPSSLLRLQVKMIAIWCVLSISTLSAWLWMEDTRGAVTKPILACIIGLAAMKVSLVIAHYMEVNHAPNWLKILCGIWVISVFGMISVIFLFPLSSAGGS